MKNKLLIRIVAIVAAALLVFGVVAACFAEDLQLLDVSDDNTVVATVGDEQIVWGDVKEIYNELVTTYGSYYDLTDPIYESLFRAVAVESIVDEKITYLHAASLGLDVISEEDKAAAIQEADETWNAMLDDYVSSSAADDATDEDKAALRTEAETYFMETYGYDQAYVENYYLNQIPGDRLYEYYTKDITVSDDEVTAAREETVAADKALYENDLEGYCTAVSSAEFMAYYSYMYSGTYTDPEYPAYKPAGFRSVQHILLNVDSTLLSDYTDKQAALEEQQEEAEEETTEETTEETAAEATETPVTEADVAAAEAAILASVAETVETINTRYAAGESFETLITEYSSDTASLYEICPYSSNYVEPFVTAGCNIENKGELSAPVVSDYGVHILLYVDDIPAGPVELSESEFETLRASLLSDKQSEAYSAACDAYSASITVSYVMPTVDEVQEMDNARNAESTTDDAESDTEDAEEVEDTTDGE